jgi:hypothetical protein
VVVLYPTAAGWRWVVHTSTGVMNGRLAATVGAPAGAARARPAAMVTARWGPAAIDWAPAAPAGWWHGVVSRGG